MGSSCDWKMTYNNSNHYDIMNLSHTPTRPPWRPAASSITALKESDNPVQRSFQLKQRSTELAVPPQQMSVIDLIAAIPKRHRVPKPQTLCNSYGLVVEPYNQSMTLKTLYTTPNSCDSLHEHLEVEKSKNQSLDKTPKLILEQAARSVVSSRSRKQSTTHMSHLASPPSGVRSLLSSAIPLVPPYSEQQHYSTTPHHSAVATPISQPTLPHHCTNPSFDCTSSEVGARSAASLPTRSQYSSSAQIVSRTPGTNNLNLVSAHDHSSHGSTHATRSKSSKFHSNNNTRGGHNDMNYYPSRGTTGGSTLHVANSRCLSQTMSGHSTPNYSSVYNKSPPISG